MNRIAVSDVGCVNAVNVHISKYGTAFYPKAALWLNDGRSPGSPLAAPSRPAYKDSGKGEAASDPLHADSDYSCGNSSRFTRDSLLTLGDYSLPETIIKSFRK